MTSSEGEIVPVIIEVPGVVVSSPLATHHHHHHQEPLAPPPPPPPRAAITSTPMSTIAATSTSSTIAVTPSTAAAAVSETSSYGEVDSLRGIEEGRPCSREQTNHEQHRDGEGHHDTKSAKERRPSVLDKVAGKLSQVNKKVKLKNTLQRMVYEKKRNTREDMIKEKIELMRKKQRGISTATAGATTSAEDAIINNQSPSPFSSPRPDSGLNPPPSTATSSSDHQDSTADTRNVLRLGSPLPTMRGSTPARPSGRNGGSFTPNPGSTLLTASDRGGVSPSVRGFSPGHSTVLAGREEGQDGGSILVPSPPRETISEKLERKRRELEAERKKKKEEEEEELKQQALVAAAAASKQQNDSADGVASDEEEKAELHHSSVGHQEVKKKQPPAPPSHHSSPLKKSTSVRFSNSTDNDQRSSSAVFQKKRENSSSASGSQIQQTSDFGAVIVAIENASSPQQESVKAGKPQEHLQQKYVPEMNASSILSRRSTFSEKKQIKKEKEEQARRSTKILLEGESEELLNYDNTNSAARKRRLESVLIPTVDETETAANPAENGLDLSEFAFKYENDEENDNYQPNREETRSGGIRGEDLRKEREEEQETIGVVEQVARRLEEERQRMAEEQEARRQRKRQKQAKSIVGQMALNVKRSPSERGKNVGQMTKAQQLREAARRQAETDRIEGERKKREEEERLRKQGSKYLKKHGKSRSKNGTNNTNLNTSGQDGESPPNISSPGLPNSDEDGNHSSPSAPLSPWVAEEGKNAPTGKDENSFQAANNEADEDEGKVRSIAAEAEDERARQVQALEDRYPEGTRISTPPRENEGTEEEAVLASKKSVLRAGETNEERLMRISDELRVLEQGERIATQERISQLNSHLDALEKLCLGKSAIGDHRLAPISLITYVRKTYFPKVFTVDQELLKHVEVRFTQFQSDLEAASSNPARVASLVDNHPWRFIFQVCREKLELQWESLLHFHERRFRDRVNGKKQGKKHPKKMTNNKKSNNNNKKLQSNVNSMSSSASAGGVVKGGRIGTEVDQHLNFDIAPLDDPSNLLNVAWDARNELADRIKVGKREVAANRKKLKDGDVALLDHKSLFQRAKEEEYAKTMDHAIHNYEGKMKQQQGISLPSIFSGSRQSERKKIGVEEAASTETPSSARLPALLTKKDSSSNNGGDPFILPAPPAQTAREPREANDQHSSSFGVVSTANNKAPSNNTNQPRNSGTANSGSVFESSVNSNTFRTNKTDGSNNGSSTSFDPSKMAAVVPGTGVPGGPNIENVQEPVGSVQDLALHPMGRLFAVPAPVVIDTPKPAENRWEDRELLADEEAAAREDSFVPMGAVAGGSPILGGNKLYSGRRGFANIARTLGSMKLLENKAKRKLKRKKQIAAARANNSLRSGTLPHNSRHRHDAVGEDSAFEDVPSDEAEEEDEEEVEISLDAWKQIQQFRSYVGFGGAQFGPDAVNPSRLHFH